MAFLLFVGTASAFQDRKPNATPRGTVIWHVNELQTGPPDGFSWATAFPDLQSALNVATSGDQIWVAQGIYLPTYSGGSPDVRDSTFHLANGVSIYGGFFGDETFLSQRDPEVNPTILSGDLQQDDQSGGNISDNAKHILTASGSLDSSSVLDGFIIKSGNANNAIGGGGILITAIPGPSISRCIFLDNNSSTNGGAVFVDTSAGVVFSNSSFQLNSASENGGGIYTSENSVVSFNQCHISFNQSNMSAGVYNSGSIEISNSLINGNIAYEHGAAIVSQGNTASSQFTNCTITQNIASISGGGIIVESGSFNLANSIVWGNYHLSGDDEFAQILLNNSPSPIQISYSCVQHLNDDFGGSNNIAENPRFVDQLGIDGQRLSGDENFHLLPTSPCIDAGNNAAAIGNYDLDGLDRFVDDPLTVNTGVGSGTELVVDVIDIGAYEFIPTAIDELGGIVVWNATDGIFSDSANWFPQRVPGASDIALFNVDNEIIVDVSSTTTLESIFITSGEIKLRIPNIDLTATSFSNPIRFLSFGNDSELKISGEGGRLILTNGTVQIGGEHEDDDDFDDFLEVDDGAELVVGMLRILDGGQFVGGIGNANITAEVRNTGGEIDPSGIEPGLLNITGDYSSIPQDETDSINKGSMVFTFDETTSSIYTHDQISISGTAQLGGVLGLQFDNNFATAEGDIFGILTAGTLNGTFDTVWSTGLPANQFCSWLTTSGVRGTGGANIGGGNPITFDAPTSTALPRDPTGIVLADFDGMNGVDIAMSIPDADSAVAGTISILLNNGVIGGVWQGFTPSPPITVGVNPSDVNAGDLDGDGDIDLVVANFTDNTISTLFNNGNASFAGTTYFTGYGPTSIAIANYVKDGLLLDDIAVGCSSAVSTISVLQNQSVPGLVGSSFFWMNNISIPTPVDILPGDVNNDKDFDYIVLSSIGDSVSVYEGDGSGDVIPQNVGFAVVTDLPSSSTPLGQEYRDLNNDGFEDLITVNNGDGSISILRSTGSAFDVPSTVPVGTFPEALTMSDLDNDGDVDVVVSVIGASSMVRELLIARNDTSTPTTIVLTDIGTPQASGFVPTYVETGDINGDGLQDIISITEIVQLTGHVNPAVTVLFNTTTAYCPADVDGDGTVAVADLLTLIAAWGNTSGAEDLNGDGIVNVADLLILIAAWGAC